MASTDLLMSLMNLSAPAQPSAGGVAVPQGQPIVQGENPLINPLTQLGNVVPSATPAPAMSANPSARQVTSLEDILFGGGFNGQR